jgi:hypothetical protein
MSRSFRRAATAFVVVAAALVPSAAHADAPPSTCGTIALEWPYGRNIVVDTAGLVADLELQAASCGIVAVPTVGAGTAATVYPSGRVCTVTVTTRTWAGVAYNLQHAVSSYVSVLGETSCTAPVDYVTQRVDALVNGVVVSSATGTAGGPTALARTSALFSSSAIGARQARYCVELTDGSDVRPVCATSSPL